MDVLLRTTEKLALDWPDEPRESRASKLDERFLIGAHSKPERRKLPFFSDLHRLISSSWKQPFSSVLTNAAAADFTNLVGSVEQGYTAMPVIEETLASHLSPSLAPSWKSRPLLPSKPCRPLLPLSGSPTSRPVRQVWPFTQWPSFRPTRRTSWRRWTKGPAWLLKPWRSYEEKPRPRALPPLRFGEPVAGLLPANNHASGLTWSGPTSLPLSLIRVVPDLWVGMRRDVLPLRGEARPRKRFCPPRTRSPHLNLSQPPFEAWCADLVHPHFYSGWQLGGRVRLSPFAARPFAAGEPHVRRHSCFSPAVYGTRAGHPSAQHFSLHHPEQGRRGLSFTVEGAAASRPSRHPISGMSSLTRHSDSSVALPSRMGASTRGIAVGSPHNSNRLHSSVWKKSPPFRRGSPDSSKQRLQGLCSTTGTFLPPTERSNRGSTAVGSRTRVLQPLLPRSKEGRRLEAYSGYTAFEFFPLQREVQDADDENHHVSGPGGRLVCHHRPEGCVFSHPGRSKTQEIPSVRLLEGRLTNTRSCPSAWLWRRGRLPNAWMLHWPLWGSRAFVYWTIWTTGSFWLTPGS